MVDGIWVREGASFTGLQRINPVVWSVLEVDAGGSLCIKMIQPFAAAGSLCTDDVKNMLTDSPG